MIDEKVTLTGGSENNDHIVSKWQPLLALSDTVGAIAELALVWSEAPLHLPLYITLWWKLSQCASLGSKQSVIYQSAILLMNWKTNAPQLQNLIQSLFLSQEENCSGPLDFWTGAKDTPRGSPMVWWRLARVTAGSWEILGPCPPVHQTLLLPSPLVSRTELLL